MSKVHTIEISITPENHAAMQDDLTEILAESAGAFPESGGALPEGVPAGGLPPEAAAACEGLAENDACEFGVMGFTVAGSCGLSDGTLTCAATGAPSGGAPDAGGLGGGAVDLLSRDPLYVPVEVRHDGQTWRHVGMRYKGNSSLLGSSQNGSSKIAFRLDFDQLEDTYNSSNWYAVRPRTRSTVRSTYISLTCVRNWATIHANRAS